MNNFLLASSILRGKWYVEPLFALSQGSLLQGLLENKLALEPPTYESKELEACATAYAVQANSTVNSYSLRYRAHEIPEDSTAIINLKGALMKYDTLCSEGTASIGKYIKQADSHQNISKIILVIDSPGGTVDGTEALANIIKATETPIHALVDGMMCSAALWIGSACDKIYSTNAMNEIGSVGVLLSFQDTKPMWEANGVKFHTITADTSPDKVKWFEELCTGNYETYRKEVLNPLDELFMQTVQENRPNAEDKHLTGKVFFAKDVMGVFVDEIATLDELLEQSDTNDHEGTNIHSNNNSMENLPLLAALFATANLADISPDADGDVTLNAEQMEAINTALESYQGDTSAIEAERDAALTAQQEAEGNLATANIRIAELEAMPGAESASASTQTDGKTTLSEGQKAVKAAKELLDEYKQNGSLI